MIDREKVLKGLEWVINDIEENGNINHAGQYLTVIKDALELLKGQEESIPVSWLKEKLEGHPELSYAVTDGINNVLDLWEGR